MSEETKEYRLVKTKPRSKKLQPRVDLAAMISVSFLLIIFFMVTKELARPQAMDLGLPDKYYDDGTVISCGGHPNFNRIITLLLDDDNKVISYSGLLEIPIEKPKKSNFGKNGIRKELVAMNSRIKKYLADRNYGRDNDGAVVIIKPSKNSNFGNLVDILDEMSINNISTYTIVNDFSADEMQLLASN
ncbi:MAG: biopolymer transporter ExbD [Flavobacterium sp.]